ncbi:hypothetical protein [Microcoleus sp. CAWBG58]|uniref:hypothetical protein n=1 Tax=Microcoleus sp. CAWBG58 TaxID=2841651 RepID=UPI0025D17681|nr:hypothetical protein [Microcoleus sp. CAWBG58]
MKCYRPKLYFKTSNPTIDWFADRPYEGMNITGVTGITQAQKATLEVLGAIVNS